MNLAQLSQIFKNSGCSTVYIKELAKNDNSKNQVYFGGNYQAISIIPFESIHPDSSGKRNKPTFKAQVNFFWIGLDATISKAPYAQLILYPDYPEVRFSGFLKGCANPPSKLMAHRIAGRVLALGINDSTRTVFGYVSDKEDYISKELLAVQGSHAGVFKEYGLTNQDSTEGLLNELRRINSKGWIQSKRLNSDGEEIACKASNCGGYTLEAELGIIPNGKSEPDYLGWEVKQFTVNNFDKVKSKTITLMTPEPKGGYYKEKGVIEFIKKFGYPDKSGKPDRMNFGGIHKYHSQHNTTKLTLKLEGYDADSGKITDSNGYLGLLSETGEVASCWYFTDLIQHWNKKHNKAVYVPSVKSNEAGELQYRYANKNILLGEGTDFSFLFKAVARQEIYYDPGIKVENISTKPTTKRRSQFRISSKYLGNLYHNHRYVEL